MYKSLYFKKMWQVPFGEFAKDFLMNELIHFYKVKLRQKKFCHLQIHCV